MKKEGTREKHGKLSRRITWKILHIWFLLSFAYLYPHIFTSQEFIHCPLVLIYFILSAIGGATGRAPCMNPGKHSMLKIQRCAQVPVGIKTNPSSHTTEVWDVHMARRAEAIIAITMNNKLRQEWGSAG